MFKKTCAVFFLSLFCCSHTLLGASDPLDEMLDKIVGKLRTAFNDDNKKIEITNKDKNFAFSMKKELEFLFYVEKDRENHSLFRTNHRKEECKHLYSKDYVNDAILVSDKKCPILARMIKKDYKSVFKILKEENFFPKKFASHERLGAHFRAEVIAEILEFLPRITRKHICGFKKTITALPSEIQEKIISKSVRITHIKIKQWYPEHDIKLIEDEIKWCENHIVSLKEDLEKRAKARQKTEGIVDIINRTKDRLFSLYLKKNEQSNALPYSHDINQWHPECDIKLIEDEMESHENHLVFMKKKLEKRTKSGKETEHIVDSINQTCDRLFCLSIQKCQQSNVLPYSHERRYRALLLEDDSKMSGQNERLKYIANDLSVSKIFLKNLLHESDFPIKPRLKLKNNRYEETDTLNVYLELFRHQTLSQCSDEIEASWTSYNVERSMLPGEESASIPDRFVLPEDHIITHGQSVRYFWKQSNDFLKFLCSKAGRKCLFFNNVEQISVEFSDRNNTKILLLKP